ncbi:MAG TPA: AmmeMemoRadiSam system radical SAM enzyme [Spirochaetales bacterium]|nr:AmmeMemoRadiSam system radical SAM enzyme [Spirochaetales bacterium]
MKTQSVEAQYYETQPDGTVTCVLCPRRCVIKPGQSGICRVRKNEGGVLRLPYWGKVSALALDPIEKKPLYHFMPGTRTFSIGYVSCNLHCPFCQNYHISQTTNYPVETYTPEALVALARQSGCPSMSHTYSEPLIHAEFVSACCTLAHGAGLASILVTNGCINEAPAQDILAHTQAVNVDLKSWNVEWYEKELGGNRDTVCAFIALAKRMGVHVEVTTLVIPGKNDSEAEIASIARFLADIDAAIPLHLSAYHPMYRYTIPPTPPKTIYALEKVAKQYLSSVYPGNIGIPVWFKK